TGPTWTSNAMHCLLWRKPMRKTEHESFEPQENIERNNIVRFPLTLKSLGFNVSGVTDSELRQAAAVMGRKGGQARTKAKIKAARANGRKGGRGRKKKAA